MTGLFDLSGRLAVVTGARRGIGYRSIAGGGNDSLTDAPLAHRSDGHGGLPVLEGGGWAVAFILDVELIQLKVLGEAL